MIRFVPTHSSKHAVVLAVLASVAPFAFGQAPGESPGPALAAGEWTITDLDETASQPAVGQVPGHYPDQYLRAVAPLALRLEYLCWWLNGNPLPPLVTTGPVGTPPVLGAPTTDVLFGNDEVDASHRGGLRATWTVRLAHWWETDVELAGHFLLLGHGQRSGDFFAESTGVPLIGRPFFNLQTSSPDALAVAAPGLPFPDPVLGTPDPSLTLALGRIAADSSSDLSGAGVVLRKPWLERGVFSCDWLAGYRYLRYQECLTLRQGQLFTDPADSRRSGEIYLEDRFSTWSEFQGVDLGIEALLDYGCLAFELLAKLAVGNVHQILDVRGSTLATRPDDGDPTTPQTVARGDGFLATPSLVGRHTSNRCGVVPELSVTMRRPVGGSCAVTLGYTLLVLPSVLRTGDQIDTAIDPSQTPGAPSAAPRGSTLWIHGINVGVEF